MTDLMRLAACLLVLSTLPVAADPVPPAAPVDDEVLAKRLQEALRAHGGDVFTCWSGALRSSPAAGGEMLFRLWISPGGAVERAEVLKDETRAAGLESCLVGGMRGWRLPELAGDETRQVVFPLAFRAESGEAAAATPARVRVVGADIKALPASPKSKLAIRILVDPTTVGATGVSMTHLVLSPSARLAYHSHPGTAEILYVLKGRAHLRNLYGEMAAAEAGDAILAVRDAVHSLESAPLAPLELLEIFLPAGAEQDYRNPPAQRRGTSPASKMTRPKGAPDLSSARVVRAAMIKPVALAAGRGSSTELTGEALGNLARLDLDAGASLAGRTSPSEEIIYVLSGKGELRIGSERTSFIAGDALRIPGGTPHDLTAAEKLSLLRCTTARP